MDIGACLANPRSHSLQKGVIAYSFCLLLCFLVSNASAAPLEADPPRYSLPASGVVKVVESVTVGKCLYPSFLAVNGNYSDTLLSLGFAFQFI
jgi:hypothetical protein